VGALPKIPNIVAGPKGCKLKMLKFKNWDFVCAETLEVVKSTGVS
jgi:hypothetical protein